MVVLYFARDVVLPFRPPLLVRGLPNFQLLVIVKVHAHGPKVIIWCAKLDICQLCVLLLLFKKLEHDKQFARLVHSEHRVNADLFRVDVLVLFQLVFE